MRPHRLREIAQPFPLFLHRFGLLGDTEQRGNTGTPVPRAVYYTQTPVSWTRRTGRHEYITGYKSLGGVHYSQARNQPDLRLR